MLSLTFPCDESAGQWRHDGRSWRSGRIKITPYAHPNLEHLSRAGPSGALFVVRERRADRAGETPAPLDLTPDAAVADLRAEMRAWPGDFVMVAVPADGPSCELEAGRWGTAPVFLTAGARGLEADWDPTRLYPHLRAGVDFGRLAHTLVNLGCPYSRRTLFPDLWQLTERATAVWTPEAGVGVVYPPTLQWPRVGRLRPDADVFGAFRGAVERSLGRWFDLGREPIATELSGGLDSTALTIIAAMVSPATVRSYGIIMPGDNGRHQAARRDEVIGKFGLHDTTITPDGLLPFAAPSRRLFDGSIVPWGEYYHELVGGLLARMRADGVRTVVTGVGGDEISTLRYNEYYRDVDIDIDVYDPDAVENQWAYEPEAPTEIPDFLSAQAREAFDANLGFDPAPEGAMELSALESAQAGAPLYLRAGVWPVSPYCDPDLVDLVRRLPLEWRDDRRLQRDFLRQSGCSEAVAAPTVTESFSPIMVAAMRQAAAPELRALFKDSRLADLGLVDGGVLRRSYEAFVTEASPGREDWFMEAAVLEATLRAVA